MVEMSQVGVELAPYVLKHKQPNLRRDTLKVYGTDTLLFDEVLFCLAKSGLGSGVTIGENPMMLEMFYNVLAVKLVDPYEMPTYVEQLFARRDTGSKEAYKNIFKKKLHTFSTQKFLTISTEHDPAKVMFDLINESAEKKLCMGYRRFYRLVFKRQGYL